VRTYVLDASALMAFLEDRPGAGKVEELLARAGEAKQPLLMSVVNWGEVCYSVWRARGEKAAQEKLQQIAQLPIEVVDADGNVTKLAATLKAKHNLLPYADCFAGALARARKGTLVTSDKDFVRVEADLRTVWL
jgi:predicted nucleic acid-binding protein